MKTLRTYFAGIGSGGSLVGAIVAGFLGLGAVVGFDGLPAGSGDGVDRVVSLGTTAPENAAATAVDGAAAPAALPAALAAVDLPPGPAAEPTDPGGGSGPDGDPGDPGPPPGPGPGPGPPDPPVPTPPAPEPSSGDVGHVVGEVDQGVGEATGLDLGLGGKTAPVTGVIDKTIDGLTGGRGLGLKELEVPALPQVVDVGATLP